MCVCVCVCVSGSLEQGDLAEVRVLLIFHVSVPNGMTELVESLSILHCIYYIERETDFHHTRRHRTNFSLHVYMYIIRNIQDNVSVPKYDTETYV